MAERMSTANRMDRARANGRVQRAENSQLKRVERANREKRMVELLRAGKFPYTPAVMSWVSTKLDKRASHVTEADIQALITASPATTG